jgi:hypothetical protein
MVKIAHRLNKEGVKPPRGARMGAGRHSRDTARGSCIVA